MEFDGFFDATGCSANDDTDMSAGVTVREFFLGMEENSVLHPVFNEPWEVIDDATN